MNKHDCSPIKSYLWKQVAGWIWCHGLYFSDPAPHHGVKFFFLLIWLGEIRTPVQSLLNKHGLKSLPSLCHCPSEVAITRSLAFMLSWPKIPEKDPSGPSSFPPGVMWGQRRTQSTMQKPRAYEERGWLNQLMSVKWLTDETCYY